MLALSAMLTSAKVNRWVGSMQAIARPMYSNPPLHGALLVSEILKDKELKQKWYKVSTSPSITVPSVMSML